MNEIAEKTLFTTTEMANSISLTIRNRFLIFLYYMPFVIKILYKKTRHLGIQMGKENDKKD